MISVPHHTDLPLRTWRDWWRHLPGYWRIAIRTVVILGLLHLGMIAWMVPNYSESKAIQRLRRQGVFVRYRWEQVTPTFSNPWVQRYWDFWRTGLQGRRSREVSMVICNDVLTDNSVFETIGRNFPNVEFLQFKDPHHRLKPGSLKALAACKQLGSLSMQEGKIDETMLTEIAALPNLKFLRFTRMNVTAADLSPLRSLTSLSVLDFRGSRLTDDHMRSLAGFQNLTYMNLDGTLITDASLPVLQSLGSLHGVTLSWTDVSVAGINNWRKSASAPLSIYTDLNLSETFAGIRLADGRLVGDDARYFFIQCHGPLRDEHDPSPQFVTLIADRRLDMPLSTAPDGLYRLTAEYQGIKLEPVLIEVQNGTVPPGRVEFRMPDQKIPERETSAP